MLVALAVVGSWSVPVHAQSPEAVAGMMMNELCEAVDHPAGVDTWVARSAAS